MFLFGIAAIAGFVLALRALFHTRSLRAELAGLTQQVAGLDRRLVRLADDVGLLRGTAPPHEAAPETAPLALEPVVSEEVQAPAPEEPATPPVTPTPPPIAAPGRGWEQILV